MFSWKEFEKSRNIFSHMSGLRYRDENGQHHLWVKPYTLLDWVEFLKDDLGFFTLIDIAAHDEGSDVFEIVYHLLNMGTHQRVNVHMKVRQDEVIPSLYPFFANADWMEREQREMFSLQFDRMKSSLFLPEGQTNFPLKKNAAISAWPPVHSEPLPKLPFNPNKSEAPYPEESYLWKKYDLLSSMTLGNFEWQICFDPLRVIDSKINVGFHHQGLEKLFEQKDILQILQLADKVNLSAAPTYAILWAKALEELYRIKIPERSQALRIVLLELARIADHLTVLSSMCLKAEQDEYRLYLNAREKIYELFEKYSGHRHGVGSIKLGGLKEDLPPGWISEYQLAADVLNKNLKHIHQSLIGQSKFRSLLEGEPVNSQSILKFGVSGPAMRAAGLNFDLRKSQPIYFYQDIDFDIPVGINGSAYDRFLIRHEEIYQSIRIITQVIDNLPLGEVINPMFDHHYLDLVKIFASMERTSEWHYSALEAPSGEAGFLVKFEKGILPSRIKMKTPGFAIAGALPIFMKGLREEQIMIALESLGLSRWEMDR